MYTNQITFTYPNHVHVCTLICTNLQFFYHHVFFMTKARCPFSLIKEYKIALNAMQKGQKYSKFDFEDLNPFE